MLLFKDKRLLAVAAAGAALCGCNLGMAPSGGTPAEIEANFHKESPQDQIRTIQMSPAPPDKKAQLIHDIETKYGIQAPANNAPPPGGGPPPAHG